LSKRPIIFSPQPFDLLSKDFKQVVTHSFLKECEIALVNDTYLSDTEFRKIKSLGIPIIGASRFDKIEQNVLLNRFDIKTPRAYYNEDTLDPISSTQMLDAYVDSDYFCIKPLLGARGIGVKKITKSDFINCWERKESIPKIFNKEIEHLKDESINENYISETFDSSDWLIQEIVNIKREFRILFFCNGEHLLYERNRKKGEFIANISVSGKPKEVDSDTEELIIDELKPKMFELMKEVNYPWVSTDVYIDNKGEVGIIEFQMEFAYKGFESVDIRQKLVNTVNYCIKNKGIK
jgi:hypothetical protein